jgi:subtilisin
MRRHIALLALLALAASLLLPSSSIVAASPHAPSASRGEPPSGRLNASGRYIALTRSGTRVRMIADRHTRNEGLRTDRIFSHAVHGFAGRMSPDQVAALRADPDVAAVVPDEVVQIAQYTPTGVSRIGGTVSPLAQIDKSDERIDADVAVVDTGIDPTHPDLNVAGGYNCTSSTPSAWRDHNSHGTHVAGTIGAIDNGAGVVGVAPGVRLWAVRILNADGYGYLSWYVCGLDWIAAQRDPLDPSRPLIESVNMSVTKWGSDDTHCGTVNHDVLHQAVCRVVAAGVTVVAAAANDSGRASKRVPASYNEVITVSALADTDGKPGGLGGHRCWSWGGYDRDDTFANFSNYGYDVDLIAPGKCIWSTLPGNRYGYMSGTSMATPHVTAAAAMYKATRPWATPRQVKDALQAAGNLRWKTGSDPDGIHEKLLSVSRLSTFGDFSFDLASSSTVGEAGGFATLAVRIDRTSTHFETVRLSAAPPSGWSSSFSSARLSGFSATRSTLTVYIPSGTSNNTYPVIISAFDGYHRYQQTIQVEVTRDDPTAHAPTVRFAPNRTLGTGTVPMRLHWTAATDPTSPIGGYETEVSVDGGAFGSTVAIAPMTSTVRSVKLGHTYRFRIRAKDVAGNWSDWETGSTGEVGARDDRNETLGFSPSWSRTTSMSAYRQTLTYSKRRGATMTTTTGRLLAIVAPLGPTRGRVAIYVNGDYRATINLHAKSSHSRRIVWAAAYSTPATRTLTLVVRGTDGHPRIDVDAVLTGD